MNVNSIIKSLENLTDYEQQQVFNFLEEKLVFSSLSTQIKDGIKESRFASGKVCPHCKSNNVSRNGKYNGKQRYICKSCNKTFTDFTFSPCYHSKKDFSKWLEYIKCMVAGYSIRKCAEIVEITVPTSFAWRHKILDALRLYIGTGHVSGLVEADETFFRLSYKGNHSKSKGFTMPRKPYLRGSKSKKSKNEEPKPRGISRNQVAVMCAIDRTGNIISELICNGRMKYNKKYDIKKSIREKKAEKCKFLYERFNVEEENLPRINTIGHLRDNLGKPPSREEVSFLRKINKDIEDLEYELRKLGLFIPTLTVSKKQLDSISNELSKNSKFKYRISETGSDFIDLNKVLNSFNFREFAKIKRQTKKAH